MLVVLSVFLRAVALRIPARLLLVLTTILAFAAAPGLRLLDLECTLVVLCSCLQLIDCREFGIKASLSPLQSNIDVGAVLESHDQLTVSYITANTVAQLFQVNSIIANRMSALLELVEFGVPNAPEFCGIMCHFTHVPG
ncbi:hypothetical protein B0H16DRAFT_1740118 [Mycena metata]|uniref:Uncharacterized protein n=1 Tax=Mycena metata TaxID=1033252 RepID=A0AAD7HEG6_9AGAR|nr:hypothetical protein B0H16DRAFT_1740118 [Mycena metata]